MNSIDIVGGIMNIQFLGCLFLLLFAAKYPGFFGFITISECFRNSNTPRYQELIVFFLKQKMDGKHGDVLKIFLP